MFAAKGIELSAMPTKGRKSIKGIGDLYDSPKSRVNLMLTEQAVKDLDQRAEELGISRSELVERFARGLIGLPGQEKSAKKRRRSDKLLTAG